MLLGDLEIKQPEQEVDELLVERAKEAKEMEKMDCRKVMTMRLMKMMNENMSYLNRSQKEKGKEVVGIVGELYRGG